MGALAVAWIRPAANAACLIRPAATMQPEYGVSVWLCGLPDASRSYTAA